MKVAQKNSTDPNTVSVALPPSYHTEHRTVPPPDRQSDEMSGTATVPGSNYFEHESCSE